MSERPIIMTGESVPHILAGRKTQTRRVIKPQPTEPGLTWTLCPYGRIGDRLWVRESFADVSGKKRGVVYRATNPDQGYSWKPSIYMPRWAARLILEIMDVRVERVQDISEEDAKAEGCDSRTAFISLWDKINAKRGYAWDVNPWVWVVTFRQEKEN